MDLFYLAVGYTDTRPVIPDEYVTHVAVLAPSLAQAHLAAAHMVGVRCEMVTSTRLLTVEV